MNDEEKLEKKEEKEKEKENKKPSKSGSKAGGKKKPGGKKPGSPKRPPQKNIYAMAGKCWDGPENDPAWYISEEAILKDAASLSYANLAGIHYTINQNLLLPEIFDGEIIRQDQPQTIPGIMVFKHINTFGQTANTDGYDDSALTSMVRALYSYVRHANSGSKNYEAPDLGMYVLAVDQLYAYIAELQRLYGIVTLYSRVNRYFGRPLVQALGFEYDDIVQNIADLRAYINMLVYKASSLAVPANFSVFARHIWLANNYFSDSASGKANIYAFRPCCYGRFSGRSAETGSEIIYDVALESVDRTLSTIREDGNKLLAPLLSDEDIGIMSGDILKAFGSENLAKLTLINEDYQVMPVHSLEVLTQIQNMTLPMDSHCHVGSGFDAGEFKAIPHIYQNSGSIISRINLYSTERIGTSIAHLTAIGLDRLISMPMDNPTPSDTMVATRLTNIADDLFVIPNEGDNENTIVAVFNATGTELVVRAEIYSMEDYQDLGLSDYNMKIIAQLSAFDFHPYVVAWHVASADVNTLDGFIFESDNYTVLTPSTLKKIHDAAVIGEIFIRSIALAPSKTK